MIPPETFISSVAAAIFASTGFWAFITYIIQREDKKKSKEKENEMKIMEMLKGLGHDRILYLGNNYVQRGYISTDEYENLKVYLFEPYEALNGNGTAAKVMREVEKLELKDD